MCSGENPHLHVVRIRTRIDQRDGELKVTVLHRKQQRARASVGIGL